MNRQANSQTGEGKAKTSRKTFSRETSVSHTIQADPGIVWALLTHASDIPRWNSTVTSMTGEIREGGTEYEREIVVQTEDDDLGIEPDGIGERRRAVVGQDLDDADLRRSASCTSRGAPGARSRTLRGFRA